MHSLIWIIQTVGEDFEKDCITAKNEDEIRNVLLKYWKKHYSL